MKTVFGLALMTGIETTFGLTGLRIHENGSQKWNVIIEHLEFQPGKNSQ